MHRFLSRGLLVSSLAVAAGGCNNATLGTGITPDTAPTSTTTFDGTLTTNGAKTFTFAAGNAGGVTVVLNSITLPSGVVVSLVLGTWNGSVCQMILSNDNSVQGSSVVGQVSAASNLCVRVADANGTIPGPTPFEVQATHP